ncbi:hypothetical protein MBANPS3_009175 [Mucor bainieri]
MEQPLEQQKRSLTRLNKESFSTSRVEQCRFLYMLELMRSNEVVIKGLLCLGQGNPIADLDHVFSSNIQVLDAFLPELLWFNQGGDQVYLTNLVTQAHQSFDYDLIEISDFAASSATTSPKRKALPMSVFLSPSNRSKRSKSVIRQ